MMATTALSRSVEYKAGEAALFLDHCNENDLKRALYEKYRYSEDYRKGEIENQDKVDNQNNHSVDCYEWEKIGKGLLGRTTTVASTPPSSKKVDQTGKVLLCRLALHPTFNTWDYPSPNNWHFSSGNFKRNIEKANYKKW